jgi:hypothetical protein
MEQHLALVLTEISLQTGALFGVGRGQVVAKGRGGDRLGHGCLRRSVHEAI